MLIFSVTFSNVLLTLLFLLPGWLLCRARLVQADHMGSVSAILLYICGPGMFLNAFLALDPSPELNWNMAFFFIFTLVVMILFILLMMLALRKRRNEFRFRMMTIASVMGNVGFFGLPIVNAVFQGHPEAAAYSCVYCGTMNILAWTLGVYTVTGKRKYISFLAAFLNPTVLSIIVGLILYALRAREWLPSLVQTWIGTIGGLSTPLCMFILGIRLATMQWKALFTQPFVYGTVLLKLIVFPLLAWLLVLPFPLDPIFKASILVLSATPCASIILNLAEMHHNGQQLAANCALLSTLLSILTIPLLTLLL